MPDTQLVPALLSQVASGYRSQNLYAEAFMPLYVEENQIKDYVKVAKFGKMAWRAGEFQRDYGSSSFRLGREILPSVDIKLTRYGVEAAVDWAELKGAEDVIRRSLLTREARLKAALDAIWLSIEVKRVALLMDPANYDAGNTVALAAGGRWDDANADILGDIDAWKKIVYDKIGADPNTISLPKPVWDKIKRNAGLLSALSTASVKVLTPQLFGELAGLSKIVIPDTIASIGGATAVPIWGKNVNLAHVPDRINLPETTPMFGITVQRELGYDEIREYKDEERTSDVVAADKFMGFGIVDKQAGFLARSVIA